MKERAVLLLIGLGIIILLLAIITVYMVKKPDVTYGVFPTPTQAVGKVPITLTLPKNQAVAVPQTDLVLTLESNSLPNSKCFDCVVNTQIKASIQGKNTVLNYACGGIAGACTTSTKVGAYTVTLLDHTKQDSVDVQVQD